MTGWINSPRHCENLMSPDLREIGVGGVTVPGSQYSTYWVQDFGTH